jgi:hypothetical protein
VSPNARASEIGIRRAWRETPGYHHQFLVETVMLSGPAASGNSPRDLDSLYRQPFCRHGDHHYGVVAYLGIFIRAWWELYLEFTRLPRRQHWIQ